ncbi:MAG: aminoacyl-tRNA hydrolase [Saezia sp.]
MIKLLVGLGNPGLEYQDTRHNAGFMWIDLLAEKLGVSLHMEKAYYGFLARTQLEGQTIWLLQPQTYMNRSGQSVSALARFFKILPDQILVVHDELDLPPGQSKLKFGGSPAGHNGLKDIDAQLGSRDYWRLRLGIGHPGVRSEVVNWVLKRPAPEHREAIEDCISRTLDAIPELLKGEFEAATRIINAKPKP